MINVGLLMGSGKRESEGAAEHEPVKEYPGYNFPIMALNKMFANHGGYQVEEANDDDHD